MKANRKMMFRRKLVYVAVVSCFTVMPAFANPIGATVVNGQVGFATQGNTLTVTNSPNSIINWQQFSINTGEVTRFAQQNAQSAVLNRVVGQDPSQLLGSLLSNGRVYLINPNGILFGQGAVIDVGGLVASTLKLTDGDFLAGRLNFTDGVGAGGINNQGSITTPTGGNVYLIAPDITNSGVITSPQGEILLAAGHTVNLMDTTNPNVQVTVGAPDTQAVNIGSLIARSGKAGIYGALIDQQGLVDANTAVVGANGKITLRASKDITLEPGSVTTASGMVGGVKDGGEIRIVADGTLNVRQGSEVHVDGGVDGGNGGFLELSGKKKIALNGSYTGRAQKAGYHNGSLLLDPLNINIVAGGLDTTGGDGIVLATESSGSTLNVAPASLNGWLDVSLAALNNITVSSPISNADVNNGTAGGSLTLTAGNDITVGAAIGTSGARFNHDLTLTAGNNVNINKSIYLDNNLLKLTAVGNVVIQPLSRNTSVIVDTLGDIIINAASLTVQGGSASASGDGSNPRLADAVLHTDKNFVITTTTGGVMVQGGTATAQNSCCSAIVNASANAELSAANLKIDTAGTIQVQGGNAYALMTDNGANKKAAAEAKATISATGSLEITNGVSGLVSSVQIIAGNAAAYANGSGSAALVLPDVNAKASADATMSAGSLTLRANGLTIRGGGAHAQAGGSYYYSPSSFTFSGSATNRSAAAEAIGLLSAGTVFELKLGVTGLHIEGCCAGTAIVNGAGGVNSAFADRSAFLRVAGDISSLTVGGGVSIYGGIAVATAGGSGTNTATEYADAGLIVGGSITSGVSGIGFLSMTGGSNAIANVSGGGVNTATATANALVTVGGNITLDISGYMDLQGGRAGVSGPSATAQAIALIESGTTQSGTMNVDVGDNVYIVGGYGANGYGPGALAFAGIVNTGPINMTIGGYIGLTFAGGNGGATYNGWTVPGTGLSPDPTTYTSSGAGQIITPNSSSLDAAFIMTGMSTLPDAVLRAVDFGANTTDGSPPFYVFFEPIRFGNNEDNKNDKPVCN